MELITTTDALAAACADLAQAPFIAVDTEFMRETTFWPELCLIQAAGGDREVIIDPMAEGIDLAPFYALLADKAVTKVFHACRQDVEIFLHKGGGLIPAPLFDTQIAAMALGLGDSISYENLVRAMVNRPLDKGPRFTDWSRRPLSESQLAYALGDVTHLRDLYPAMRDKLASLGRDGWMEEEMATLTDPATYQLAPEDAWKRLKIRKRTPKWLAALKAAAAWREREARERNIPRNRVMKDDALYEIVAAAPTSTEALKGFRAVPRGFERSAGAERLIEAMQIALADPQAYAPKVDPTSAPASEPGPTADLLKVLLRAVAEQAKVAPRLIASAPELERIAADDKADVPALKGWRRALFGEQALKLKRGELALILERGKVEAVELEPEEGAP